MHKNNLKQVLLKSVGKPLFFMEAHNAISAKIVEKAGFKAIWASGLTISTSLGFHDNNELSEDLLLRILECMTNSVKIPILVDGDVGFGNFNNARLFVRRLQRIGVAGVCIEDKIFPKKNSLLKTTQSLEKIRLFSGKIRACRDFIDDPNFLLVARIEALIAGKSMHEALKRARAYEEAGADAIIIHSKKTDGLEIIEFLKKWKGKIPIIIIPTKYYTISTTTFKKLGVSGIIWANHNLRASMRSMQTISEIIHTEQSTVNVQKNIISLNELFSLMEQEELEKAEKEYTK